MHRRARKSPMSAVPPLPPPLQPVEATGPTSIEGRIRAVEQRLLARERALGLQFADVGRRLRAATQPRRVMSAALGVAGAVLALWWLRRRAPTERALAAPRVSARPSAPS